jgi:hypothetical protein
MYQRNDKRNKRANVQNKRMRTKKTATIDERNKNANQTKELAQRKQGTATSTNARNIM